MAGEKNRTTRKEWNTVCFTGHRIISAAEIPQIRQRLQVIIRDCYVRGGYRWFICGGALGFDTLAAREVLAAKTEYPDIRLLLAIPCADQAACWNDRDRMQYQEIRELADDEIVLSPHYYKGCMHLRNQFMVHHSSVCICYLRRFSGGTGYTVRYALSCQREVINLCLPDSGFPVRVREPSWNFTYIFPSVSANVLTVRSIPIPAAAGRKWNGISMRFSGKRPAVRN